MARTTNEYRAISPSRNDQWFGRSCRAACRPVRATPRRSSNQRAVRPARTPWGRPPRPSAACPWGGGRVVAHVSMSQKPGPTRPEEVAGGDEGLPSRPVPRGSCGSGQVAGPNTGWPVEHVEGRLVARAQQLAPLGLVKARPGSRRGADLQVGDPLDWSSPPPRPGGRAAARAGLEADERVWAVSSPTWPLREGG